MFSRVCRDQILFATKAAFAAFFVFYAVVWGKRVAPDLSTGNVWINDFWTLWSGIKFAFVNPPVAIYNTQKMIEFQMYLGSNVRFEKAFVYPPSFLLLIYPFGFLTFRVGYAVWTACTFALYFIASQYKEIRRISAFVALLAPASIVNIAYGQTGFLVAALITGGCRLSVHRPVASGILFGFASVKPQFGVLVPIALLSARQWRSLAAASATVCLLVLASGFAFGWSAWPAWWVKLLHHGALEFNLEKCPTIASTLISIGVDRLTATTVQLCVGIIVASLVWMCFRSGVTALATAALLAGSFLVTPYAFVYDLPMITTAVIAVLVAKSRTRAKLSVVDGVILGWALLLPAMMMESWRLSILRSVPLLLLFGLIVFLNFRADVSQRWRGPPSPANQPTKLPHSAVG